MTRLLARRPASLPERAPRGRVERALVRLGADPDFVEALLGDIAEERAERAARDGAAAAGWWCAAEMLRALPHLAWSGVRYAARRGRARLAAYLALLLAPPALLVLAIATRPGPPARLVPRLHDADGVVVNGLKPSRLVTRVLDARGRAISSASVQYRWLSGMPLSLTADGVVRCTRSGDARVRVSVGAVARELDVRCRPVRDIRAAWMMEMVEGAPPHELVVDARGVDGEPVAPLTGIVTVSDTTVARLEGLRVTPRAPGRTTLSLRIGDRRLSAGVWVYPRVADPGEVGPGEMGAVPVRVAGGELLRWRLPASPVVYHIRILPDRDEEHLPGLAIVDANCLRGVMPHSFVCRAMTDATVMVYHPRQADPATMLSGHLAIWRPGIP